MKKALIISFVLCLVASTAFAAKGSIKVGAQTGLGIEGFSMRDTFFGHIYKGTMTKTGFYFAATGEYGITDAILAKAEFGFITGNIKVKGYVDGEEQEEGKGSGTMPAPVNYYVYLGGEYAIEIDNEISLLAGAGVELGFGKFYEEAEEEDFRIGAGLDVAVVYAINKIIDVKLGGRFAVYFVDANEEFKLLNNYDSHLHYGVRVYAGCTFKL